MARIARKASLEGNGLGRGVTPGQNVKVWDLAGTQPATPEWQWELMLLKTAPPEFRSP
jgi:hypothetical protein